MTTPQRQFTSKNRHFANRQVPRVILEIESSRASGRSLLRGIADSLTGKMADPSLYGARVREAWRAWRELPRYRILQRADLMAQMLYLVLTVICIFYLVVISIDWYDGVIRIGDFFMRQIAIDGRYRDFPIWSFVIPSLVLMAWKALRPSELTTSSNSGTLRTCC